MRRGQWGWSFAPAVNHLHLRESLISSPPWDGHADDLAVGCGSLAPLRLELASVRVDAVIQGPVGSMRLDIAYGAERDTIVQERGAILPGRRVGTADGVVQVTLRLITNGLVRWQRQIPEGLAYMENQYQLCVDYRITPDELNNLTEGLALALLIPVEKLRMRETPEQFERDEEAMTKMKGFLLAARTYSPT